MFTITVSQKPVNDLQTHTLYLPTSAVNSLPIRRRLTASGKLKESVILLGEFANSWLSLLSIVLRIKHVALNFTQDFKCDHGIVPGSRIIGKLTTSKCDSQEHLGYSPHDKLLVFPYLTCWLQGVDNPCDNCIAVMAEDVNKYSTHRNYKCLNRWHYGKTLDGGLQDYIRVPLPAHSIVKIPSSVSLHDCCFLFDIALPFYAYCRDFLCSILELAPDCRILVILNDSAQEANDCLLVIHHLRLDHLLITFTDMNKLKNIPSLLAAYANKFHHVLVFASGQGPITTAMALGIPNRLKSAKFSNTIALFGDHVGYVHTKPPNRTIYKVKLSYKDKFLMEELLNTLAYFNKNKNDDSVTPITYMQSEDSAETIVNQCMLSEHTEEESEKTEPCSPSQAKKKLWFEEEIEAATTSTGKKGSHISWLHCDRDFRLCLDDHCAHDTLKRCHSTSEINTLLHEKYKIQRVFYTNRPASHVKINAFIF